MKQELDRVKGDLEAIQKAMGFAPGMGRDWVQWMRRDNWSNLWWCLPGVILIISAFLPLDATVRYLGLVPAQWTGLAVCAVMLGMTAILSRKVKGENNGRPESLIREYKRMNGLTRQGAWLNLALGVGLVLFFVWARQHHIAFGAFWSGLFIFMGSSCLVAAAGSGERLLLGWAIPFLGYGLFETVAPLGGTLNGIPLGIMFIAVALSFSLIQVWQIREIESQHAAH